MKNKKKWEAPKIQELDIKKQTSQVIVHNKEVSPNWSWGFLITTFLPFLKKIIDERATGYQLKFGILLS